MENGMCDRKKERRRIDDVDRISALPEPILQLIMSFLPFNQLVQISVLSKAWLQAWRTFPVLKIDEVKSRPNKWETKVNFRTYWEKLVQFRHGNMVAVRKLTLKMYRSQENLNLANQCICYAIANNVKELELELMQALDTWCSLPQMVLCSKSINVLKLQGYKLESLPLGNDLNLSLRKLSLSDVYADDQVMNNLVAQCPLIEDLEFDRCQGFKSLDIKAPNASSMAIATLLKCEVSITSCKNLKRLDLWECPFPNEWLCSQISRLPLLERLFVRRFDNIERIKISSTPLRTLGIGMCERLVEVELDTPNLRIFKYIGDVVSLSSGALTLSETELCFSSHNADSQWYANYIELLARFHKFSKVLNLRSKNCENVDVPGELRLILPHPLSGVKHLNFTATLSYPLNFAIAKVMDFLLWISPHAETVRVDYKEKKKFYFQFTYKQQPVYEGKIAECCKSLPISCWEHCIKKVEIDVNSTYFKMNMNTREIHRSSKVERFVFYDGENVLEKIDSLAESGTSHFERIY